MDIQPLDPVTAPYDEVLALAGLDAVIRQEGRPAPVPCPAAQLTAMLRAPSPTRDQRYWVARDGGRVLGRAQTRWLTTGENLRVIEVEVVVRPDARGRGIATALLHAPLQLAREVDRSVVMAEVVCDGPGAELAKRLGLEQRAVDRRSILDLTTVDHDALREWGRPDDDAAGRYSLVHWRGPCPVELREDFAVLCTAMNDAPRQQLEWEDEIVTPDIVRLREERIAARGDERWTTCARDDDTGHLVAMTDIEGPGLWPEWALQDDTVVLRAHRGHGLGRWIKVENLRRMVAERPTAIGIETWNAVTNSHMLAINEAMGFRPANHWAEWQAPLDVVATSLRGA